MEPFMVEFVSVHRQTIAASDLKAAAAVAAAIAATQGYKVHGVYTSGTYAQIQQERERGKTHGKV